GDAEKFSIDAGTDSNGIQWRHCPEPIQIDGKVASPCSGCDYRNDWRCVGVCRLASLGKVQQKRNAKEKDEQYDRGPARQAVVPSGFGGRCCTCGIRAV